MLVLLVVLIVAAFVALATFLGTAKRRRIG
jgi:hypothetical protein